MYFAQIFKYEKVGDVVWEGPVENVEEAEKRLEALEKRLNIALDLEYWLITPQELKVWADNIKAQIEKYCK